MLHSVLGLVLCGRQAGEIPRSLQGMSSRGEDDLAAGRCAAHCQWDRDPAGPLPLSMLSKSGDPGTVLLFLAHGQLQKGGQSVPCLVRSSEVRALD